MSDTHCADCGAMFKGDGCTTGYGSDAEGVRRCYSCITFLDTQDLKTRKPFVGYISSNGNTLTNWPGGVLGRVVRSAPCALTRTSYTHNASTYRTFWVRDVHGGLWVGRGSPGIAIKMRPTNAK